MSRAKDLTGMRFGRLTVIERVPSKQNANRRPFEHQNQWTKAKENADAVH